MYVKTFKIFLLFTNFTWRITYCFQNTRPFFFLIYVDLRWGNISDTGSRLWTASTVWTWCRSGKICWKVIDRLPSHSRRLPQAILLGIRINVDIVSCNGLFCVVWTLFQCQMCTYTGSVKALTHGATLHAISVAVWKLHLCISSLKLLRAILQK